jgi:hypothetical protein
VPAYGWLANGLGDWASARLGRSDGVSALFDRDALRAPLERARAGDLPSQHQVWSLIVLDLWLERWVT